VEQYSQTTRTATTTEVAEAPLEPMPSLRRRLLSWRTLLPLAIAVAGLAIALPHLATGFSPDQVGKALANANLALLLLGLLSFYASFVLRTLRWRLLLENMGSGTGQPLRLPQLRRLTEILYLSWYANVLVPAKLGDFYRAHLLKEDTKLPMSRTYGTVLAERALDLTVLLALFVLAALASLPAGLPDQLTLALRVVAVVTLVLCAGLIGLRIFGSSLVRYLPHWLQGISTHFLAGTVGAFKRVPLLLVATVAVWALETGRFLCAAQSVGLLQGGLLRVLGAAAVVALAEALLTAVPFTSGGIGFVEAGMLALLLVLEPSAPNATNVAAAAILLDRILGLGSILLFGTILLLIVTLRSARSNRAKSTNAVPANQASAASVGGAGSDGEADDGIEPGIAGEQ
jgi:uncharacterized membrane protein YbhN (UPF0104 family)